jgi:hypothetical protein
VWLGLRRLPLQRAQSRAAVRFPEASNKLRYLQVPIGPRKGQNQRSWRLEHGLHKWFHALSRPAKWCSSPTIQISDGRHDVGTTYRPSFSYGTPAEPEDGATGMVRRKARFAQRPG